MIVNESDNHAAASSVASFGWEIDNLNGNGADVYFPVVRKMKLQATSIDAAFMISSQPASPGFAEVLCQGAVFRGGPPVFDNSAGPAYLPTGTAPHFGSVAVYNPNNLLVHTNPVLYQDLFYSVILKSWVPGDGTASAVSRHVLDQSSLLLRAGDYLAFHMDHAGVPCGAEMQVVMTYALL